MKYKIIRKHKKDVRDFEIGYADSKEQADGLLAYYNETDENKEYYYIKGAITEKQYREKKEVSSDR